MNKWLKKGVLIVGYCVPFAFIATYGDAVYHTMALYALMVGGYSGLCYVAVKSKQMDVIIVGNILSSLSSYYCSRQFYINDWNGYFKPFTPSGLIIIISGSVMIIQLIVGIRALWRSIKSRRNTIVF